MAEEELKHKLGSIIKKHKMDAKTVTKAINKIAPKLDLEHIDKESAILKIVELAGKEGLEVETGFYLIDMEIRSKMEPKDILKNFREIVQKKEYKDIKSKIHREKLAARAVKARIAWEARVQSKIFDIVVLGKESPRMVPTKSGENTIAKLAAFCTPTEDDSIEPFYRILTFWGEIGTKVNEIIIGHRYHCNLVRNRSADSLDAWDPVDKTEFIEKGKFDGEISEILEKIDVQKIEISEAEFNVAKGYGLSEHRRIDCEIMGLQTLTRGDKDIGMMFVIDESSEDMIYGKDGDEDSPSGGFTMFTDPQNLVYGEGSEISVIGRISRNEKDGRVVMNVDAIIPILVVPIDLTPVDDEDEVGMRTGDESVIDPDTLAPTEGGEDEDLLAEDDEGDEDGEDMFA